jgi:hypothetical protein
MLGQLDEATAFSEAEMHTSMSILRTIDKQHAFDSTYLDLVSGQKEPTVRRIHKIRQLCGARDSTTPYCKFIVGPLRKDAIYIIDSGADVDVMSKREALRVLGENLDASAFRSPFNIGLRVLTMRKQSCYTFGCSTMPTRQH